MLTRRNPKTTAPPPNLRFSHSVEIPSNARWLYLAGQVGITPEGTTLETLEEQDEQIWQNTILTLEDAGFGVEDIVKLTVFSTDPNGIDIHMKHRAKYLNSDHTPASTWLNISSLATPQLLIEMETVAAKAT